jgi:rSAM/selenodomain-associated transferase 2
LPIPDLLVRAQPACDAASIAIIVPLLNEADGLPRLLQRLQGCRADEMVIVDGGSTDGSTQLLEKSGIRWLASPPGRAVQMNAGARVCTSDFLLFLHTDTDISSDGIEILRGLARKSEVVGGRFDVRLSGAGMALRVIEWFINFRSRLTRINTGDQAMFVRREVFERMDGFASIPLMEDIEFSRRLKRQGSIACLHQKVQTSSRRWEKDGILRTVLLMWGLRLLFWLGVSPTRLAAMYHPIR